jgi:hypothetical protein
MRTSHQIVRYLAPKRNQIGLNGSLLLVLTNHYSRDALQSMITYLLSERSIPSLGTAMHSLIAR